MAELSHQVDEKRSYFFGEVLLKGKNKTLRTFSCPIIAANEEEAEAKLEEVVTREHPSLKILGIKISSEVITV